MQLVHSPRQRFVPAASAASAAALLPSPTTATAAAAAVPKQLTLRGHVRL